MRHVAPTATSSPRGDSGRLRVTHPDRVIDASTGLTKLDLVRYYASVAGRILPHLKGRAVAEVRGPQGIGKPLFFQRNDPSDRMSRSTARPSRFKVGCGPGPK